MGLRFGEHGLPLMGCGDWNDGMNLVGKRARARASGWGSSCTTAHALPVGWPPSRRRAFAERCRLEAAQLRRNIEQHGWDGDWYRRA